MSNSTIADFLVQLTAEKERFKRIHMLDMFKKDSARFEKMSVQKDGLVFDYSKNLFDRNILLLLTEIAKACNLEEARDLMFSGAKVNTTECKAALHTALRCSSNKPIISNGKNVILGINNVLTQMTVFANAVRNGTYQVSGGKITDIINIGIGGSDLGPRMVTQSLKKYNDGPRCHFVSNVDSNELSDTLESISPETTLFLIASKTFKTKETILNAKNAKAWVENAVGAKSSKHFCALTSNFEATREFGIPDERTFRLWDWVGGRYSVWSAVGLSVMIAIGPKNFNSFLSGAYAADKHFINAPLIENIPVIMALLGIWYCNVLGYAYQAIIPYDSRMAHFPVWLQQLHMQSNGKSILLCGKQTAVDTGPIIFGGVGTNSQHAFFQFLHQSTDICPCDFLIAVNGSDGEENRRMLLSNCLAQSESLMSGRTLKEAKNNPHRAFEGNRPSNTFLYKELTPYTLGIIIAFYKHKVFVQGVMWGINSFDQWGDELGKELTDNIQYMIETGKAEAANNPSTRGLLNAILGV